MRRASRIVVFALASFATLGCATEPSPSNGEGLRWPVITNYGGHLLSPMRLVAIAAADDPLRDSLFAFAKAVPASRWWKEVSVPYGISSTATAFTVTGPPIAPGTLTFTEVVAYVQKVAIDSAGFVPDGRTIYLIYLPPGVNCTGSYACTTFSAFHSPFGTLDGIAVLKRSQTSTVTSQTVAASHEIAEAVSDPQLDAWKLVSAFYPWESSPWALDDGGNFEENGDLCGATRYTEGGFTYQRIFTNQAAALRGDPCVPSIAVPYYLVTSGRDWYSTTTGAVDVQVTGWSAVPVADWLVTLSAATRTPTLAAPTFSMSCADSVTIAGTRYCAFNRGRTATARITLPPGALSKTFFSVRILSFRVGLNGERPPSGEDATHRWIFGVYVP